MTGRALTLALWAAAGASLTPDLKMASKREVDTENRWFNDEWTDKYVYLTSLELKANVSFVQKYCCSDKK